MLLCSRKAAEGWSAARGRAGAQTRCPAPALSSLAALSHLTGRAVSRSDVWGLGELEDFKEGRRTGLFFKVCSGLWWHGSSVSTADSELGTTAPRREELPLSWSWPLGGN